MKCVIKGLRRCPACKSSNIYKRVRSILEEQGVKKGRSNRKENDCKDKKTKQYRCHVCKHEFDEPVTI